MSETDDSPRCCGKSYDRYYGATQCTKRGKVERDGKSYCGIHDPVAVKARKQVRDDAWKAKRDTEDKRTHAYYARRTAESAACRGVATEVLREGLVAELIEVAKKTGVWRAMGMEKEVNP
jgi:hypothetical protein